MRFGFALVFALIFLSTDLEAAPRVPPPPVGWVSPQSPASSHSIPGAAVVYSSPVVAELDKNPSNGKEIVLVSRDGAVAAYRANGSLLWTASAPNSACDTSSDKIFSSPAVGDLFGDGTAYVVVGYGGFTGTGCDGGVTAFRGDDGARRWNFSLKEFGRKERFGSNHYAVFGTPALADADGDGRMEIAFGALDRNVYLLSASGRVRWYYNAADTVFSSAAFVNVDRDRDLEIVIGTDISANPHLRPPTKNGGYVYAFNVKRPRGGSKRVGFQTRGAYLWRKWFDQVIQSAPVAADVLPGSRGDEIVVGSGCYFPSGTTAKTGRWVKILSARRGRVLATLRAPACFSSSPALADIDEDGSLEIVATVNGSSAVGGDGRSRVVAWKAAFPEPMWETTPLLAGGNDSYGGYLQSPVAADIDGNGSLEIIAANQNGVVVLAGRTGAQLTCPSANCASSELLLRTGGVVKGTPAVADLNNDGTLELIVGSANSGNGALYAWSRFAGILRSAPGSHARYAAPWPMFRGGPRRTGIAGN